MSSFPTHPLETIMRQCEKAGKQPWYPSAYAQEIGIPREDIDPFLDQLRMGGLIQLTEWVQGKGQGYILTPEGSQVLSQPRAVARLRDGKTPAIRRLESEDEPREGLIGSNWEKGEAARAALLHPRRPMVTFILLAANIGWFLWGLGLTIREDRPVNEYLLNPVPEVLERIGLANGPDVYLRHEWWRLLTCCFVHIGIIHLAVNMYSLWVVGPLLEQLWGSWQFLVLYLVAGLGGSCGMLIDNPVAGGAGASGALWGIMASMATWLFFNRRYLPPPLVSTWQRQLLTTFLLNVFITFSIPMISKGAHFGGGFVGLVAAVPMNYLSFGRGRQRIWAILFLIFIPVLCIGGLTRSFAYHGDRIKQSDMRWEARDFLNNYAPRIRTTWQGIMESTKSEIEPLLDQPPGHRRESEVKEAIKSLGSEQNLLDNLSAALDDAGPYWRPQVDNERKIALTVLEELKSLLILMTHRLENHEEWRDEDQATYQNARRLIESTLPRWGQS